MRRAWVFILIAAVALSAVAVDAVPAAAAEKLRIGIHRAMFGSMDVVAEKKGFLDEYLGKGNWSTHSFAQGKLMLEAILAGSLDTGTTGFSPFTTAIAKGGKLTGFAVTAHLCNMTQLMVSPDSPIQSVKDLKGKKVISAKGTSTHFTFENFILPAHGLSVKDVEVIEAVTTNRIPILRARAGDVAIVGEPMASIAMSQGHARMLETFCKYDVSAMMSVVAPKTLAERRGQVANYVRAWLKAAEYYRTNFDDYARTYHAELVSKGAKVPLATTRTLLKKLVIAPELTDDMLKHLQNVARIHKKVGRIPREPDFARKHQSLDLKLLQEAKSGTN